MMHVSSVASPWFGATGATGVKRYSHGGRLSLLLAILTETCKDTSIFEN